MSNSSSHVSSLPYPPFVFYFKCLSLLQDCGLCEEFYLSCLACVFSTVSEMEESMLSALRPPEHTSGSHNAPPRYTSTSASAAHGRMPSDPSELPPDRLHVEMEMSPDSQIILYGPLLRALVSIKVQNSLDYLIVMMLCRISVEFVYLQVHKETAHLRNVSNPLNVNRKTILARMTCTQTSRRRCPALCYLHQPPQALVGLPWEWRTANRKTPPKFIHWTCAPGTSPCSSTSTKSTGGCRW